MRYTDRNGKPINIRKIVRDVIFAMPVGTKFSGYDLKDMCIANHPELENAYVETFLKTMRFSAREICKCVNHNNSIYMRVAKR